VKKEQEKVFLKPGRPGLIVRDPRTLKPLAEDGEEKPKTNYWLRRIRCGDAIVAAAMKTSAPKQSKKEEKPPVEMAPESWLGEQENSKVKSKGKDK